MTRSASPGWSAGLCPVRLTPITRLKAGRARGGDPGRRGLERRALARLDVEPLTGREEHVGGGLGAQPFDVDGVAVDPLLDQMREPGPLEDRGGVRARGDDGTVHAEHAGGLEVGARAREGRHALELQTRPQPFLLAVRQPVDGLGAGRVVRTAFGQADATAGEERADSVEARPAGDPELVVVVPIEGRDLLAAALRPLEEEAVERVRPGGRVEARAGREDAVEVEHAGDHLARQAEDLPREPWAAEPLHQRAGRVAVAGEALQQVGDLVVLLGEAATEFPQVLRAQGVAGGVESALGRLEREPPLGGERVQIERRPRGRRLGAADRGHRWGRPAGGEASGHIHILSRIVAGRARRPRPGRWTCTLPSSSTVPLRALRPITLGSSPAIAQGPSGNRPIRVLRFPLPTRVPAPRRVTGRPSSSARASGVMASR